jgi:hypothetical protein
MGQIVTRYGEKSMSNSGFTAEPAALRAAAGTLGDIAPSAFCGTPDRGGALVFGHAGLAAGVDDFDAGMREQVTRLINATRGASTTLEAAADSYVNTDETSAASLTETRAPRGDR